MALINYASAANGGTVSPDSTASLSPASYINDGVKHTAGRWDIDGGSWQTAGLPSTAIILFSQVEIERIDVFGLRNTPNDTSAISDAEESSYTNKDYTVSYLGADNTWHVVATITDNHLVKRSHGFSPVLAKGVKVVVTANNTFGFAVICELEAWGHSDEPVITERYVALGSSVALGSWEANNIATGGTMRTLSGTIDRSGVTNPAPENLYKAIRETSTGTAPIVINQPGLTPNAYHLVEIHAAYDTIYVGGGIYQGSRQITRQINFLVNVAKKHKFYLKTNSDGNLIISLAGIFGGVPVATASGIHIKLENPPASAETKIILCKGDSMTEGEPTNSAVSYPEQLAGLMNANYYKYDEIISFDPSRTVAVINVGFAGQSISDATYEDMIDTAAEVDSRFRTGKQNILLFYGGSNDIQRGLDIGSPITAATLEARTTDYLANRKAAHPGWQIVDFTITPRFDQIIAARTETNDWKRNNYLAYADGLVDIAANPHLGIYNGDGYFADSVHPTTLGYAIFALLAKAAIEALPVIEIPEEPSILDGYFEQFKLNDFLNITSLGLSMSLLVANFGDGYQAGALSGKPSGLRKWTIQSNVLPDLEEYQVRYTEFGGSQSSDTRFNYLWEFYRRHLALGNKPFYFVDPRTGRKFLASFTEFEISFESITAKLYSGGIPIMQRRVKIDGITFRTEDGSIEE